MKLVELRPKLDCNDIAVALRNIADDIAAGKYEFDPTIAVLVLGTETERRESGDLLLNFDWQTHGLGRAGFFASKGLLAAAISGFDSPKGV